MQMSKLIMSHMSKEPFHLSYWPTLAMASTLANSYLHLLPAFPLALLVNGLVLAGYLHYVSSVVVEICEYLDIKCFSIPVLPVDEAKE
jgi:ethanolaminephosphotransferase